jgi:hypothetical protein
MMEIEFEKIEDRTINFIEVCIYTELGCDLNEGEYSIIINSFIGTLDISSIGGVDDISLIKDCIENSLDDIQLANEGCTQLILKESGEWEGYSWHKYYEVHRVCVLES